MTPSQALLRLLAARDALLNSGPYDGPPIVEAAASFDHAVYDMCRRAHLGQGVDEHKRVRA